MSEAGPGPGAPFRIRIVGTGRALPSRKVSNHDLSTWLDTSDEWIRQRTGIQCRYWAGDGETAVSLARSAAAQALERAGMSPAEIRLIVFATVTPDHPLPFCAALLQRDLGADGAAGFDVTSGCAGFVQSVQIAAQFIRAGVYENALVVGADTMSSMIDRQDRNTAVIFGDGAGAMVMRRGAPDVASDLLAMDGGLSGDDQVLVTRLGGSRFPIDAENVGSSGRYLHMDGPAVFRFAVDVLGRQIHACCERAGATPRDIKLIVPHQVNRRIIESAARRCAIPIERFMIDLDRLGNTGGASVPIALDEAIEAGRIEHGDLLLMVGFGSGLAWASALFRY
jgi:3-oxoacyl-[acyl-carrier-protein] synthase III